MRIEIYAMRNDSNDICIMGTAHSKTEYYYLKYKALLKGFDYIGECEY